MRKVAERHGIISAYSLYVTFTNPINVGDNFSWSRFPDYCARYARATAWQPFSPPQYKENKLFIDDWAADAARGKAENILKEAGLT